ncbi:MAG: tetratricopeptide repeat protein [Bacteroidales bacterium]|nr:tetratricopeptide repeat protein [Bacteroidales bacterium]MCF8455606.1 tetratricopeptide repeat protein [Bacteroidales bacterium]
MRKFKIYSLVIGILLSIQVFGQKEKIIDSLESILPGLQDSARIGVLCELSYKYRLIDLDKSYSLLHESIILAKKMNQADVLKLAYSKAVQIHYKNGNIDSALIYSHRFYDILVDLHDSLEMAQAANNLGVLNKITGDHSKALEFYKISLDIKIKMKNQLGIAKSLNNMGLVYEQLGAYEKALDYYLKSLDIKRKMDDQSSTAASLINIGNIYEKLSMDSLAFASQYEALGLYEQSNNLKGKATAYNNLGELMQKRGDVDQAFTYFEKALALNDSVKNISGLAYSYNNLGSVLARQGKKDEAIRKHKKAIEYIAPLGDPYAMARFCLDLGNTYLLTENTRMAKEYLDKSLQIARKEKLMPLKYKIILSLSKLKYQQGKYYAAFDLQEQGHAIKDSIFNEESKQAIANLQIINEVDAQQKHIESLTKTNSIQQEKLKQSKYFTWSLAINLVAFFVFIIIGIIRFRHLSKLNKQLNHHQSELTKQNEFLGTLIKTIPMPMIYKDKDLKIVGCNSYFEEMIGKSEKELIGSTLEKYQKFSNITAHHHEDKKALEDPGIRSYEEKIVFADKKEHDVIVYKSSFKNENNEVAGILGIILDITSRKQYEKELHQNEQRLVILNELYKDLDGLYEDLVCKSHQKICEFTSATASFCLTWVSDDRKKMELCSFNATSNQFKISSETDLQFGNFPDFETIVKGKKYLNIQGKDEGIKHYSKLFDVPKTALNDLQLLPIIEGDNVVGIAGIANFDRAFISSKQSNLSLFVSEIWSLLQRKKSLVDLEKSKNKLKETIDAKDKFFSIIAHDLKNPFNAILGFAQLLSDYFHEFDENEKFQYIQNLREASEATYKLLENLLQWSFAQTGKVDFKPEEIDLSVLANECAVLSKPSCDKKDIHISIQIEFNSTVFADSNMVQTIFRNLLSNAIKFSNRGQTIKLKITNNENFRTVHVIDEGVGINSENMNKLFKVGEKVKSEGTEYEKGTGLGLLLCKEFVEMNGGTIQFESEPGKGSTFSFSLPRSQ